MYPTICTLIYGSLPVRIIFCNSRIFSFFHSLFSISIFVSVGIQKKKKHQSSKLRSLTEEPTMRVCYCFLTKLEKTENRINFNSKVFFSDTNWKQFSFRFFILFEWFRYLNPVQKYMYEHIGQIQSINA